MKAQLRILGRRIPRIRTRSIIPVMDVLDIVLVAGGVYASLLLLQAALS